jgi:opacity protein-like surface antigen
MKKVFLLTLLTTLFWSSSTAQIKKGSWLVGGGLGLSQSSLLRGSQFKYESTYLIPEFGYFMTNRWMIGARAGMSLFTTDNIAGQNQQKINYESYLLEPYARLYFNLQHRLKPFYEFSITASKTKFNNITNLDDSKLRHFAIGSSIGADYFLTDNIAIEGFINYSFYNKTQYIAGIETTTLPKFILNPSFLMRLFLNTKGETIGLSKKYFAKGNLTYGVRMNWYLSSSDKLNTSTFTPNVGYFVMDNLMVGSEFSIYYAPDRAFGIHFKPEIRYYQPLSHLTQWFGRMLFSHNYSTTRVIGGSDFKFKTLDFEAGLGINRFLAPNISVQTTLNLELLTNNLTEHVELKPNLKVGFQYFMSKK